MHHANHMHGHGHTAPPFINPHPHPPPHPHPHQPPLPVPQQPTVYSRPEVVGHPTIHHVVSPLIYVVSCALLCFQSTFMLKEIIVYMNDCFLLRLSWFKRRPWLL